MRRLLIARDGIPARRILIVPNGVDLRELDRVAPADVRGERGIPAIVGGFALPDDRIHAPDESYRIGAGDHPTVLLHGFLGSGKNLRSLAQRWAEGAGTRVAGRGDGPVSGYGENDAVTDAFFDKLAQR